MNIGIIGRGVVGNALAFGLQRGHEIISYDKYKQGFQTMAEVAECSVIFISVPTPMELSGKIDLSPLESSIAELYPLLKEPKKTVIAIKSTATSGTTESFKEKYPQSHWAFVPEFLTERNANQDFINTDRIVIGTDSKYAHDTLEQVFREAKFTCPIVRVGFRTSEAIKYISNAFLASKATFANEMYEICQRLGIDWKIVKEVLLMDKRIGKSHLNVPGPDGDRGWGGRCFPKDINALIYLSKELGYHPYFLEEVWRSNLRWRKKKDW